MVQSPLLDEGGSGNGRFSRIVKFDIDTGKAVAQYAYLLDRSGQGQGISALVALNESQFLVLERNNRGLGIGATLTAPFDKLVYLVDISSATDVSGLTLPSSGTTLPSGVVGVSKVSKLIDLAANTLAAIGNKVPEKWEGLSFGPKLADGSFLLVSGTDNDYSITQNGSSVQFDVYLRFSDTDPYSTSIQCPIGLTTGCSGPSTTVPTDGSYQLLPGVLQAYRIPAADLPNYQAPVPGPLPLLGAASALAWSRRLRRRIAGGQPLHRGGSAGKQGGAVCPPLGPVCPTGVGRTETMASVAAPHAAKGSRDSDGTGGDRRPRPPSLRHPHHVDSSFVLSLRSL